MASRLPCLLLLILAAAAGSMGTPVDSEKTPSPALDITVDYSLGHPLFGNDLGPFPAGISLTLTCSSTGDQTLSWWDGDSKRQLEDIRVEGEGNGRSIVLEALSASDNGRTFTCKTESGDVERTISIEVENSAPIKSEEIFFDIIVNEETLDRNTNNIKMKSGTDLKLTCVVQGYKVSSPSWFEENIELPSKSSQSSYAASSVLTLLSVATENSGRRLSCRSDGSVPERTVKLQVFDTEVVDILEEEMSSGQIIAISFIVVGGLMLVSLFVVLFCLVKKYNEAADRRSQVSKVSDLFKRYNLLSSVKGLSKNEFTPQLVRGPYKPCTVVIDPEDFE